MVDPYLDEKLVLILSSSFMDVVTEGVKANAVREAYGPTKNQAFCYEYCGEVKFGDTIKGSIILGMDGYTKLLLLPYLIEQFDINVKNRALVEHTMEKFLNHLWDTFYLEIIEILPDLKKIEAVNLNHEILNCPEDDFRKYTIIFFLKDEEKKKYLGRAYLHLIIQKLIN